jgi:hypothetical protein
MSEPENSAAQALIQEITSTLNEPNIPLVQVVLEIIGPERARVFFEKTLETEAAGGLFVRNKSRRRTPGGVFFQLVREGVNRKERTLIFANQTPQGDPNAPAPTPPVKPITWAQALGIAIKLLSASKGDATVKLTLIGRPKQIAKAQACIVCMMEGRGVPQGMPKGLPTPPANFKQNVAVFIAEKQWRKVESSLKENKDDELIIDGWPYFDPAKQVTVLLAQGVTTKLIQRGRKEQNSAGRAE